jgi:hypothetical protein
VKGCNRREKLNNEVTRPEIFLIMSGIPKENG